MAFSFIFGNPAPVAAPPAPVAAPPPPDLPPRCAGESGLGKGTYGKVYKAWDKERGELVAVKLQKTDPDSFGISGTIVLEIAILRDLAGDDNVVQFYGPPLYVDCDVLMVFELADGTLGLAEPLGQRVDEWRHAPALRGEPLGAEDR